MNQYGGNDLSSEQRAAAEIDRTAEEFKTATQDAVDATGKKIETLTDDARAFAKRAVDTAGEQLNTWRSDFDHGVDEARSYVIDQPMKAVMIAAAGGAVLMALLSSLSRGRR